MSSNGRPSLVERRATELRLEVARIAMRIFTADGDASATVDRIAAAAGISTRTFHRHFAAKEDVVRPLFQHSSELTIATLRATPPDADLIDALVDAIFAQPHQQSLTTSDLTWMQIVARTPEFRLRWLDEGDNLCVAVTEFLAERADLGPDPRLHGLPARLVAQTARYVTELWMDGEDPDRLDELLRDGLRTALAGVGGSERPATTERQI